MYDAVDHDDNDAGVIILIYCVISLNWASPEVKDTFFKHLKMSNV